ncbi:MAG: mechanosensitive ion channel [Paludibacter sp.]|nr:mechanosensitive ion channel [Paludibacter sp.]
MKEILNYKLFEIDGTSLNVFSLLKLFLFVVTILIIIRLIKKVIFRITRIDQSKKYAIFNLLKYFILVLSFVIGLQMLGFNLSILIASSAALLVGVGLGLQNLFSDFVSGIILLIDSSVKVNDIIDVNGLVCQVQEINLRTTTVLTRDDKYIILPNTQLTQNQLINWTHSDITSRFEIKVGVDYSSDVNLVMNILKESVVHQKGVKKEPVPFVRFTDYGDSSLNFEVFFWSDAVFRAENIKSEIRVRIFDEFKKKDVTIPFPQRVVHIEK